MGLRAFFGWVGRFFSRKAHAPSLPIESDLDAAVAEASAIYRRTPLAKLLEPSRQSKLSRSLFLELHQIFSAPDVKATCRDKLVEEMLRFAPFQVVMIPAVPDADPSGLRDLPGVSGELGQSLAALLQTDLEFRRQVDVDGALTDNQSAWSMVRRTYWQSYWFLQSINAARVIAGDISTGVDWFNPFLHAVCVNQEHQCRRILEMPLLFPDEVAQAVVSAYSIYTDVVLSGAVDPDSEWREYCDGLGIPGLTGDGEYLPSKSAARLQDPASIRA